MNVRVPDWSPNQLEVEVLDLKVPMLVSNVRQIAAVSNQDPRPQAVNVVSRTDRFGNRRSIRVGSMRDVALYARSVRLQRRKGSRMRR